MTEIPFEEELLACGEGTKPTVSQIGKKRLADMEEDIWEELQSKRLEGQQVKAIKMAVTSSVSLIHGPSGTQVLP